MVNNDSLEDSLEDSRGESRPVDNFETLEEILLEDSESEEGEWSEEDELSEEDESELDFHLPTGLEVMLGRDIRLEDLDNEDIYDLYDDDLVWYGYGDADEFEGGNWDGDQDEFDGADWDDDWDDADWDADWDDEDWDDDWDDEDEDWDDEDDEDDPDEDQEDPENGANYDLSDLREWVEAMKEHLNRFRK
jgi:hypothetical protein